MANIIPIINLESSQLDIYTKYTEAQLSHIYEPGLGVFIAESPKVIERALADNYEPISVLIEDKELKEDVLHLFHSFDNLPIYTADYSTLTQLTGYALTRGMLCAMRRRVLPSADKILGEAKRIVILEDVMNPTNVGAIFRSAAALNMDGLILTPSSSDPLYRRSIRVSMGTVFQFPWTIFPVGPSANPEESYIQILKKHGFKTVAFALRNDSVDINNPLLKSQEKLAIIVGTEGEGLQASTLQQCDYTVKIPMSHNVDSLNVAAASAIAFWELSDH